MKVLYDHQIFSYQEYGGASRYFYELLKRLPPEMWDLSVKYSNNQYLRELQKIKQLQYVNFFYGKTIPRKGRIMLEMGKYNSLKKIKKNDYDIVHLTHYESYCLESIKKPIVVSYLDKLFSSYEFNQRTINEQKKCIKKASAIICISNNTKNDFLSLFDYPENKTHVIHLGTNCLQKREKGPKYIKERYVLYVGGRLEYKNFVNFAKAFSKISEKDDQLFMYCTGRRFNADELKMLINLRILDKVKVNYVTDEQLSDLYANALCFVFPSKYEGFGMPLLEAMNNNCPVCCSNSHCFPEIAGNAAAYFNPDSIEDIQKTIESVIYSTPKREELIRSGIIQRELFSWNKCANEHVALYKELLGLENEK